MSSQVLFVITGGGFNVNAVGVAPMGAIVFENPNYDYILTLLKFALILKAAISISLKCYHIYFTR